MVWHTSTKRPFRTEKAKKEYVYIILNLTLKTLKTLNYNEWRKIICLRKSEVSVGRISVCNVIENLAEMAYIVCHTSIQM